MRIDYLRREIRIELELVKTKICYICVREKTGKGDSRHGSLIESFRGNNRRKLMTKSAIELHKNSFFRLIYYTRVNDVTRRTTGVIDHPVKRHSMIQMDGVLMSPSSCTTEPKR